GLAAAIDTLAGIGASSTADTSAVVSITRTGELPAQSFTIYSGWAAGDQVKLTLGVGEEPVTVYTVQASDISDTGDAAGDRAATLQAVVQGVVQGLRAQTTVVSVGAAALSTVAQVQVVADTATQAFVLSSVDTRLAIEHNPFDALSQDQQRLVADRLRPAQDLRYSQLSASQRQVVQAAVAAAGKDAQFFNYSAQPGRKLVTDFSQGLISDYRNDQIFWGSVEAPAPGTAFADLSAAQQDVVARSLGYERQSGVNFFKADAAPALDWVSGFTEGGGSFDIATTDWGGVPTPAAGTTFEQLSSAQRAQVLRFLGYDVIDRQVLTHADGRVSAGLVEGATADYDTATFDWGPLTPAAPGSAWADLNFEQQERLLAQLGFSRWDGLVYHQAGAPTPYRLGFEAGKDFKLDDITWNRVDGDIPAAGTALAAMTPAQRTLVLEQAGLVSYSSPVYYKADALAGQQVVGSFTVDYSAPDAPTAPTKRWLITDGTRKYLIYAYDATNDGVTDAIWVQEPHVLLGQRGAGFLLTGTVTTLQDNSDFVIDVRDDAIVNGGRINLLGAGSDLVIKSDRSVYWQGEATVNGSIVLEGRGAQAAGQPLDGVSVYVHGSSTLSTITVGSSITITGAQDVELHGAVLAGAVRGETGTTYLGPDSTISITAGEQILINNSLAAAKSVTLTTTSGPGADDDFNAIVLDTAAGITSAGWTSDGSGGEIRLRGVGNVVLGGMVLAGGTVVQTFNGAGRLTGETINWSNEISSVNISASGQLNLGIETLGGSGTMVEKGARVLASQAVTLSGGANSERIGVRLPGAASIAVANPNGEITINAAQDAWLM
ncbi:MAG: hypothetical protein U1E02_31925, partial [Hydrogenophaga sp.]|nr:hypothetical protein [Hydrogenophaga sp.]